MDKLSYYMERFLTWWYFESGTELLSQSGRAAHKAILLLSTLLTIIGLIMTILAPAIVAYGRWMIFIGIMANLTTAFVMKTELTPVELLKAAEKEQELEERSYQNIKDTRVITKKFGEWSWQQKAVTLFFIFGGFVMIGFGTVFATGYAPAGVVAEPENQYAWLWDSIVFYFMSFVLFGLPWFIYKHQHVVQPQHGEWTELLHEMLNKNKK